MRLFKIKLNRIHEQYENLTAYEVAKQLNLNENTVRKFLTSEVIRERLPNHVIEIAEFYGVDWKNPDVVEIIEVDEDSQEGQEETLLATA